MAIVDEENLLEPYVLVEETQPARLLPFLAEGQRPELLLLDRVLDAESDLSAFLFDAGFDVFRTADLESARDMIASRSTLVMAVVRLDLPGLDPSEAIGTLARVRPGLWIGMRGGDGPEELPRAREGFRAGADDLLPLAQPPAETAERLWNSLGWAERKRLRNQRRRRRTSMLRLPEAACLTGIALAVGVLVAISTGAWLDLEAREEARVQRLEAALEGGAPRGAGRPLWADHWSRSEELDLERRRLREETIFHQEQLEETRLEHLFRNVIPHYEQP